MNHIAIQYYRSTWGELILGSLEDRLCLCDWRYRTRRAAVDARIQRVLGARYVEDRTAVHAAAIAQLEEYARGERRAFTVPLLTAGSAFQKRVWEALLRIPFGATASYRGLAEALGDGRAVRAVAAANGANAISIFIPCHRIVGSDGQLVGYAGGLQAKRKLLELEREPFTLTPLSPPPGTP